MKRPQGLWFRKALFQIHLWTGIAMGIYVILISVSGSFLFFRNIINASAPGRQIVAGSGPLLSKAEMSKAAKDAYPGYGVSAVIMGSRPGQEVEVILTKPDKVKHRVFDPYTGRDLGEAVPMILKVLSFMLNLHVNLLAGDTGKLVNGACSIILTILAITGAIIWWPGIQNWRRSLMVNPRANWKRINWDLHSAVGFWTFAFFFMWSFTGIYLVWPMPFDAAIDRVAPLDFYRLLTFHPPAPPEVKMLRVADVAPLPEAPKPPVRRRRPPPHYSKGDWVIRTLFGAHFGNFAGLKTRITWAVFGMTPVFLFVTGAIMWWNRVLSKEGRKLKRAAAREVRV